MITPAQTSSTTRPPLEQQVIQTNVTYSPISRVHVNTWEYKDHTEWMDKIHPGDEIALLATGNYPYTNVIEFARIDVYCAW